MARARFLIPLLVAVGLFVKPAPAAAQQVQTFFDPASFTAVAGNGLTCEDFNDIPAMTQFPTLSLPGVTFSSTTPAPHALMAVGPASVPGLTSTALLANDFSLTEPSPLVIDFAPGVQAASLEVFSVLPGEFISPPGTSVFVLVAGTFGSEFIPVFLQPGAPTFIGFVAPVGTISNVTLVNPPFQARFIAADNVCFGNLPVVDPPPPPPVEDPLEEALDALEEALADGRAAGEIRKLGTSLEDKLADARAAVEAEDAELAAEKLVALGKQVKAQRGKHISREMADELLALIAECLELL